MAAPAASATRSFCHFSFVIFPASPTFVPCFHFSAFIIIIIHHRVKRHHRAFIPSSLLITYGFLLLRYVRYIWCVFVTTDLYLFVFCILGISFCSPAYRSLFSPHNYYHYYLHRFRERRRAPLILWMMMIFVIFCFGFFSIFHFFICLYQCERAAFYSFICSVCGIRTVLSFGLQFFVFKFNEINMEISFCMNACGGSTAIVKRMGNKRSYWAECSWFQSSNVVILGPACCVQPLPIEYDSNNAV